MTTRLGFVGCFLVTLLAACTFNEPKGLPYSPVHVSSSDKALVYFYRPSGEKWGYDRTYFLAVNDKLVVDLLHGGYFPYETAAGSLSLVSDVNKSLRTYFAGGGVVGLAFSPDAARLSLSVEPGKTYYVRMRPEAHAVNFTPHLTLVPDSEALKEIAECKLLVPEP